MDGWHLLARSQAEGRATRMAAWGHVTADLDIMYRLEAIYV